MFEWSQNKPFKSNTGKCHLLVDTNDSVSINVGAYKMDKNNTEKLLAVKRDKELTLDYHISETIVKTQVGKYLLWPKLHHKWEL